MGCSNCYEDHGPMLPELCSYDWREVFKYAQPKRCEAGHQHGPKNVILGNVDTSAFNREDVKRIIAMAEGENDGPHWVMVGKLKDGRFFCIRAWCDYTGWG